MSDLFQSIEMLPILRRLVRLRERASGGTYTDVDYDELSACVNAIIRHTNIEKEAIAVAANVSSHTLSNIARRKVHPRYYNFMSVVGGCVKVLSTYIADERHESGIEWLIASDASYVSIWRKPEATPDKLDEMRQALGQLVDYLQVSNVLAERLPAKDLLLKMELITLLETTLNMLKGPLIEEGFVNRTKDAAKNFGSKIFERSLSDTATSLLRRVIELLPNL